MSEIYDATYAVMLNKIHNTDIGAAVESALNTAGLGYAISYAQNRIIEAAAQYDRPSVLFKPKVYQDGNKWCALYGENLMEGVCAFGDSPSEATYNFDLAWTTK